ncbi:hypothetical protein ACFXHD_00375 [Streptomyces hydrogenans]|uniref:hypothetical protein n=1 Tax=Streptomyces hydrogenans TaxID=1873719 RepID=UPI0036B79D32
MPEYSVSWTIDVDADTPALAALAALAVQRDPSSWATVFTVHTGEGDVTVDLASRQAARSAPNASRNPTA